MSKSAGIPRRSKSAASALADQLVEAWEINNRINLFLIEKIDPEGMRCTLSTRGGRDVARQFAHMHNVRLWHLERRAKEVAKGLGEFDSKEEPSKQKLAACIVESARRVRRYIERVATGDSSLKVFKRGIAVSVAYFISHESHHRGSILLTLKSCGFPIDEESRYAIWNWDKI
jgi:uncharacterized damage-inducible protein DinB